MNRHTATLYSHKLREVIAARLECEAPGLCGAVAADESYFDGTHKAKRGRGVAGKVPVSGLLKRAGRVHAVMIPDTRADTLVGIIRECVVPVSVVYTEAYRSNDVLDVSEFHHQR